jgi:hypothetical protein
MSINKNQIPSPDEFCFETPLYTKYLITIENFHNISLLESYVGPKKYYCPLCNHDTIYKREFANAIPVDNGTGIVHIGAGLSKIQQENAILRQKELMFKIVSNPRIIDVELLCSMDHNHKIIFQFYITDDKIMKIGQYPSTYDLDSNTLKEYKKYLKVHYEELCKAIKLNAFGIGIGSYVYLRRIFERLVFETFQVNESMLGGILEKDFLKMDMKDRIKVLKDYLPTFMVDNSILYKILSKGIHELDEDECLNYFNLVKECIIMILQQKIDSEKKNESVKRLKDALQKANNKL